MMNVDDLVEPRPEQIALPRLPTLTKPRRRPQRSKGITARGPINLQGSVHNGSSPAPGKHDYFADSETYNASAAREFFTGDALLFAGGNGRYCGLAIVAEIGEGIFDASHFLDAPTFGPALLLYVGAACLSSRRDLGQSCLAHVGKVCDMLLEASGNAEISRFDVGARFFDILRAGTSLRHRARHEQE